MKAKLLGVVIIVILVGLGLFGAAILASCHN